MGIPSLTPLKAPSKVRQVLGHTGEGSASRFMDGSEWVKNREKSWQLDRQETNFILCSAAELPTCMKGMDQDVTAELKSPWMLIIHLLWLGTNRRATW